MEVGNYVKCVRAFAYKITNDKGYYKVEEVAEDGTAKVEVVWHENAEYIGRHETIRIDDFEEVNEATVFAKFDEEIAKQHKGWEGLQFNFELTRMQRKIVDKINSSVSTDCSHISSYFMRHLFAFLYMPEEDAYEIPNISTYIKDLHTTANHRSLREYVQGERGSNITLISVSRSSVDEIEKDVEEFLSNDWTEIEFPSEFLMPYKAKAVACRIVKNYDSYVLLSSERGCVLHEMGFAVAVANDLGKPLSEDAIKALHAEDGNEYFKIVTAGIDEWFERTAEIRKEKKFEEFSKEFSNFRAGSIDHDLDRIMTQIRDMQDSLRNYFARKQDLMEKKFYLDHGMASQDEFIDMLRGMDRRPVVSIEDGNIYFCVITPLTYWDDDLWNIVRESDDNFDRLSNPQKVLLDKIFKDREIKLLFEQKFRFKSSGRVEALRNMSYYHEDNNEGLVGIPNPHMHFYNCWGTHEPYIEEALSKSDYMTAYAQAVACISGVTLDDSTVLSDFLRRHLFEDYFQNQPCLELADGSRTTIKKWLEENKDVKWEE